MHAAVAVAVTVAAACFDTLWQAESRPGQALRGL